MNSWIHLHGSPQTTNNLKPTNKMNTITEKSIFSTNEVNDTDIRSFLAVITPEQADEALRTSKGNRLLRETAIDQMAFQMENGEWTLTGEPIIFSIDGSLIDGHHRLSAVVRSGKSILSIVTEGIPLGAFAYIDIGIVRRPGDIFHLAGITDSNNSAAAVRASLEYQAAVGLLGIGSLQGARNPSKAFLVDLWKKDMEQWEEAASIGGRIYKALSASRAMITGMVFLFLSVDSEKARAFCEDVITGASLVEGNAALTFRNNLMRASNQKMADSNRRSLMVKFCQCWNAYRKGQRLMVTRHNEAQPIPNYA